MEKVTLARGKQFDCDYFNPSPQTRQINIRIFGSDIVEVATVFSDPTETATMLYGIQQADDFTDLVAIAPEGDAIRVVLRRA